MILNTELLLNSYVNGYFPMADADSPESRAIIPLDGTAKIRKSVKQLYRNHTFDLYINRNFEEVMQQCFKTRAKDTWINDEMLEAYTTLHAEGFAHSFEAYEKDELVGGLYGVSIGKAFFGESMFFKRSGASKIAFMFLIEFLQEKEFVLLDSQYLNDHTASLGAIEISKEMFLQKLDLAINDL
jgi:leucyl/phenylalanyl-tRNA--protein transferase